jgi:hypothetical protein
VGSALLDRGAERRTWPQQVCLTDELVEAARTDLRCKRPPIPSRRAPAGGWIDLFAEQGIHPNEYVFRAPGSPVNPWKVGP